jgi:hypothetical protein
MTAADVREVRLATEAEVVVVHLEAINHCVESRRVYEQLEGVLVPADGETLQL